MCSCGLEILLFCSFRAHDTYLCGPMETFHGRVKYFKIFIDDFSMKTYFYTMKIKLDVLDKLKVCKKIVKIKIKIISK